MSFKQLNDFPDLLSPMLVKELRQGLRTRGFIILFIAMQVILSFILVSALGNAKEGGAGTNASIWIFCLSCAALWLIQPLRGQAAISSEIKGQTIETLSLTRLTAWRMVFGKWIAIVSQSALIQITIIPYLILRYFLGGMNLVSELVMIILIFFTSMALTAISVGFSKGKLKLLNVLLPISIFSALSFGANFMLFSSITGGRSGGTFESLFSLEDKTSLVLVPTYIFSLCYLSWCALSHGASTIAPYAENHSTLRRLVATGLTSIMLLLAFLNIASLEYLRIIVGIIIFPAICAAMLEPAVLLPTVISPFVKRGKMGKVAGLFLYPGWPSGSLFSITLFTVVAVSSVLLGQSDLIGAGGWLAAFGTMLLAGIIASFFYRDEAKRPVVYLICVVSAVFLAILIMALCAVMDTPETLWAFVWDPFVFLGLLTGNSSHKETVVLAAVIVDAGLAIILVIRAMQKFKTYKAAIQEAELDLTLANPRS